MLEDRQCYQTSFSQDIQHLVIRQASFCSLVSLQLNHSDGQTSKVFSCDCVYVGLVSIIYKL